MRLGLFFGSFNPVHNGHLIIAQHVLNFYADKVLFVISPLNPQKKIEALLKAEHRIALVKKAIASNSQIDLCDIELRLPVPSYTINTLEELRKEYSDEEFYIILGSDNFLNITSWKSSNILLEKYNLIVFERPGFLIQDKKMPANIFVTQSPLINISSTEIRNLIKVGKSIRYLVPDTIIQEIENNVFFTKHN